MSPSQKRVLLAMACVGLLYFALFASPNAQGARDANMLAVFETDEFAQYPHLLQMLTPGDTFYQTIRNFAIYQHYFYGYPFYFFSAIALLPVRLLGGEGWASNTAFIVLVLRQLLNVLPGMLAAGLLTWTQTRFKSARLSVGLFIFLLIVPALAVNNLWWHPDGLLLLFVALTFFFLDRDNLRFGRNFYLAAAACGLATAAKHLGLFFFLAIPVYIVYGWLLKKIRLRRAILSAALFVGVMLAALVISNPLLLLPQERAEIISVQKMQWQQTTQGYWTRNLTPYFQLGGEYPEDFRLHYGELFFMLLALTGLAVGFFQPERRLMSLLVLAWTAPYMFFFLVVASTHRTHYFLPVALPLFSCLVSLFQPLPGLAQPAGHSRRIEQILPIGQWALGLLILLQAGLFVWKDAQIFSEQLNREHTSPGIRFSQQVEAAVFDRLPAVKGLLVFHDWKIYVPAQPGVRVEMSWDLASYAVIRDLNPDVILLEESNLDLFSSASVMEQALDPGDMAALHEFYADAASDRLEGYHQVYGDSFGVAFVSDSLYDPYFKSD